MPPFNSGSRSFFDLYIALRSKVCGQTRSTGNPQLEVVLQGFVVVGHDVQRLILEHPPYDFFRSTVAPWFFCKWMCSWLPLLGEISLW